MVLPTKPKSGSQISVPAVNPITNSVTVTDSHKAPAESIAPDVSPVSTGVEASDASDTSGKSEVSNEVDASVTDSPDQSESTGQALITSSNLPASALGGVSIFKGDDGNAYMEIPGEMNAIALRIGSSPANRVLQHSARQAGNHLKAYELRDINDELIAHAEHSGIIRDVYYRCAPIQNGVELDIGDALHTRIRVTAGKVAVIEKGSKTLFYRTPAMRSLPIPTDVGDIERLNKYLNLHPTHVVLFMAFLTYTLAHPKVSTTNFVILVLFGDQGSGKSFLCRLIQDLLDPNLVGVQTFPTNQKDLVVSSQHAHVLFFDNMRDIKPAMADKLCIAATGGHLTARRLYTDAEQQVHRLHVALVLNGIHSFINTPDLAQRCLPLHLLPINEKERRSETELLREFQADLPVIFRGMLDLIAEILKHLHTVEVTNPERMIDFSRWLAAMEMVDGVPTGVYQTEYSEALNEGMLESLLDNPLASAVMSLITDTRKCVWSGTPAELLQELNQHVSKHTHYSKDWPQTASALSRRLKPLQAALKRQGIEIQFGRGKHRKITITNLEAI